MGFDEPGLTLLHRNLQRLRLRQLPVNHFARNDADFDAILWLLLVQVQNLTALLQL